MNWMSNAFSERVPFRDCNVELTILDDDNDESYKGCYSFSILKFINKVINSLAMHILVSERTVGDLSLRDTPEIACAETFSSSSFYSRNPFVMKKMLKTHRNDPSADGLYSHSRIAGALLSISNQIFLKSQEKSIQLNDSIMTCEPEFTKKYRSFLQQFFSHQSIQSHFENIEQIIDQVISSLDNECNETIINNKIKLLATTVMSQVFLGSSESYEDISSATVNIVPWITDNLAFENSWLFWARGTIFPSYRFSSDAKLKTAQVLTKAVSEAIQNAMRENSPDSIVKEMLKESFTKEQIKAMIMTLFVAGQDNVSTSLTHAILKLAQDSDLQQNIADENTSPMESVYIRALLCESLRVMCPIGGIGRIALKNLLLTLTNKNDGGLISKTVIKKGDLVDPMPIFAAKDPLIFKNPEEFKVERHLKANRFLPALTFMPFGHGPHLCPGWYLYYTISAIMISRLAKNYHVMTKFEGEPKLTPGFVTSLKDSIPIKLYKR